MGGGLISGKGIETTVMAGSRMMFTFSLCLKNGMSVFVCLVKSLRADVGCSGRSAGAFEG